MRPLLLKGHERSITCVVYNVDGDLLFTASKDDKPTCWYSENGERVGTYVGHSGAVWRLDVSQDSVYLISGSADTNAKMWEVQTGKEVMNFPHRGPVRSVQFSYGDKLMLTSSDPFMSYPALVRLYSAELDSLSEQPLMEWSNHGHEGKIIGAHFVFANQQFMTTGEDGFIRFYDAKSGEKQNEVKAHDKQISNVCFNKERTLVLTASADSVSRLYDVKTMEELKTFATDRPVNGCAISPLKDHVFIGGGQDAMSVTTTSARSGGFECQIFHMVYEQVLGTVKGHFGPINCIAIHPDGRSYASGGEDGYIRLHFLDPEYFEKYPDTTDDDDVLANFKGTVDNARV